MAPAEGTSQETLLTAQVRSQVPSPTTRTSYLLLPNITRSPQSRFCQLPGPESQDGFIPPSWISSPAPPHSLPPLLHSLASGKILKTLVFRNPSPQQSLPASHSDSLPSPLLSSTRSPAPGDWSRALAVNSLACHARGSDLIP